jgi:Tfp pilus assembly protein PilF
MLFGYLVNPRFSAPLTQSGIAPRRAAAAVSLALLVALLLLLGGCGRSDTDAAADAARAQALLEQRRIAEARLAIRDAIEVRDDEPQFHILRGRIEMAAQSLSGAFDAYSDAMSLDSTNMEALQAVSQLGLQTGNFRQSLEATDAILALSPDEPGALLMRGLHAVIRKRFDEADGFADRILARNPADEGGVILKARIAVRKGTPQRALEVLAPYGAAKPNTAGVVLTRLEVYRAMRDAAGMRSQFALLRTLVPDNPELRLDEANFAFKDGRAADGHAVLVTLLADPAIERGPVANALALWREYSADGPGDAALAPIVQTGSAATRLAVAEFLAWRGRLAAARRLAEGTGAGERAALDALILSRERRWSAAEQRSTAILARDETDCLALTIRAEARLEAGDPVAAQRSAQVAAAQCPAQLQAWRALAAAYEWREDLDNARRAWREGVNANRQDAEMAGAAVAWLLTRGQDREALAVARRLSHDAPALLGGWRLYRATCDRLKDPCAATATAGLRDAATLYAIDLPPGQALPNGLFGRIIVR